MEFIDRKFAYKLLAVANIRIYIVVANCVPNVQKEEKISQIITQ